MSFDGQRTMSIRIRIFAASSSACPSSTSCRPAAHRSRALLSDQRQAFRDEVESLGIFYPAEDIRLTQADVKTARPLTASEPFRLSPVLLHVVESGGGYAVNGEPVAVAL